jgi:endonuclease/exonuclease/phosphatase family metal-dependent hydrolase
MPNAKIACWNIYFSWNLVEKHRGELRIVPRERTRSENVGRIIREMDADLLGIVEGASKAELDFFRKKKCPQYDRLLLNEDSSKYTIAVLYKSEVLSVTRIRINDQRWRARIGNDRSEKFYKFTRPPLVVRVRHVASDKEFVLALVHLKSKRPSDNQTREQQNREAIRNRKRIVAEAMRLREILYAEADRRGGEPRFMIMGDINDGPDFDRYEAQILRSGIESLLGSVLDPDKLLRSFVDLSDGKGQPSSSFARGSVQLDHIAYTASMVFGRLLPKIRKGSGAVRSDLVDITRDGKRRDSDHAPIEVKVRL